MVEEKEIIDYYLEGHSIKDTLNIFHIGEKRFRNILKNNGLRTRTAKESHPLKFNYNFHFFTNPSEELFYFLGFMGADGTIANKSNQVCLEIQDSDSEVLEKLKDAMELERPIKHYTTARGYDNAKLYIEDKRLKDKLQEYNLIPNKTYNDCFSIPDNIPSQFFKDYLRGYFDGDGCIKQTGPYHYLTFQIDGSLKVMRQLADGILKYTGVQVGFSSDQKRRVRLHRITAYSKKAKKIFDYMYQKQDSIYLERKYQRYLQYTRQI